MSTQSPLAGLLEAVLPDPALTTVRMPCADAGATATRMLADAVDPTNDLRTSRVVLPTELIVGTTSAAPSEDEKFFSGW